MKEGGERGEGGQRREEWEWAGTKEDVGDKREEDE